MRELQPGLWHWQAPHPDWTPGERWAQEVSSYAIDDGARLLLFDPLAVPDELLELAGDREPVVDEFVITAEQAGDGSPDLRWLGIGGGDARWYAAGDRLPIGIDAFPRGSTTTWCSGSRVGVRSS